MALMQYETFAGIKIYIREDNQHQDLDVVHDIIEHDAYRLREIRAVKTVVDVGSHIGTFSLHCHKRYPDARIVCCEVCPENIPVLSKNVNEFAHVLHAAVTYEKNVALLNSVFPHCVATGGSIVCSPEALDHVNTQAYWADKRPIETRTLEQVMYEYKLDHIDLLKLDCEGSEFSILENTTSLDKISRIVGEWHGRDRFFKLVEDRFGGWEFKILQDGDLGLFWLTKKE